MIQTKSVWLPGLIIISERQKTQAERKREGVRKQIRFERKGEEAQPYGKSTAICGNVDSHFGSIW